MPAAFAVGCSQGAGAWLGCWLLRRRAAAAGRHPVCRADVMRAPGSAAGCCSTAQRQPAVKALQLMSPRQCTRQAPCMPYGGKGLIRVLKMGQHRLRCSFRVPGPMARAGKVRGEKIRVPVLE